MKFSQGETLSLLRDWLLIALGVICYVVGYVGFQLPYHITPGGVSGISAIIFYSTGFPPQYTYFLINIGLILMALKVLGFKFMLNTIYAVCVLTVVLGLAQDWMAVDGKLPQILGSQSFMACIIGAILEGLGLGFIFLNNGSTGGTDIIAACINKYRQLSIGQILLMCDILVASSSYLVFGDLELLLYGYCSMVIEAITIDYTLNRPRQSVQFMIISKEYKQIAQAINDSHRGVTLLDGMGWYTKSEQKVLLVLARRNESTRIFRIIKKYDPNAFVSQSKVVGVFGEGFDMIKGK